jgi:hypothetical protein
MEPGGSLPYSQEPPTCPYPEPAQSSPCPPIPRFKFIASLNALTPVQSTEDGSMCRIKGQYSAPRLALKG